MAAVTADGYLVSMEGRSEAGDIQKSFVSPTQVQVQGSGALEGYYLWEVSGAVPEVPDVLASEAVSGTVVLLSDSMLTDKQGSETVMTVISAAEGLDWASNHGLISVTGDQVGSSSGT